MQEILLPVVEKQSSGTQMLGAAAAAAAWQGFMVHRRRPSSLAALAALTGAETAISNLLKHAVRDHFGSGVSYSERDGRPASAAPQGPAGGAPHVIGSRATTLHPLETRWSLRSAAAARRRRRRRRCSRVQSSVLLPAPLRRCSTCLTKTVSVLCPSVEAGQKQRHQICSAVRANAVRAGQPSPLFAHTSCRQRHDRRS